MPGPSTEERLIFRAADQPAPVTPGQLRHDLQQLGLRPGMVLLVHTRLSALGWIAGGAQAVLEALRAVVTETGTLVMPSHSAQLTDPSRWQAPPVPEAWWPVIRAKQPPWNQHRTPSRQMGTVAELFRLQPDTLRSDHPHVSFAAQGPDAPVITADHQCGHGMDDQSPLGRLHDLDARVLLLGVDHSNNSSLHLAESRADFPGKKRINEGAPLAGGWHSFTDWCWDDCDFAALGRAWEGQAGPADLQLGTVGRGQARLLRQQPLVAFASNWLSRNR